MDKRFYLFSLIVLLWLGVAPNYSHAQLAVTFGNTTTPIQYNNIKCTDPARSATQWAVVVNSSTGTTTTIEFGQNLNGLINNTGTCVESMDTSNDATLIGNAPQPTAVASSLIATISNFKILAVATNSSPSFYVISSTDSNTYSSSFLVPGPVTGLSYPPAYSTSQFPYQWVDASSTLHILYSKSLTQNSDPGYIEEIDVPNFAGGIPQITAPEDYHAFWDDTSSTCHYGTYNAAFGIASGTAGPCDMRNITLDLMPNGDVHVFTLRYDSGLLPQTVNGLYQLNWSHLTKTWDSNATGTAGIPGTLYTATPHGDTSFDWCGSFGTSFTLPNGEIGQVLAGNPNQNPTSTDCAEAANQMWIVESTDTIDWAPYAQIQSAGYGTLPAGAYESAWETLGTSTIFGFGRPNDGNGDFLYFYSTNADRGTSSTWSIVSSKIPIVGNATNSTMLSPTMFPVPGAPSWYTLMWTERDLNPPIWIGEREITFYGPNLQGTVASATAYLGSLTPQVVDEAPNVNNNQSNSGYPQVWCGSPEPSDTCEVMYGQTNWDVSPSGPENLFAQTFNYTLGTNLEIAGLSEMLGNTELQ